MTDWNQVPLPKNIQLLPRDKRGFPVPCVVTIDKDNNPLFKMNDVIKSLQVARLKLCSICKQPLKHDMWLIGGPYSTFLSSGVFLDPPVHYQCGKYALQVCPYMASENYNKKPFNEERLKEQGVRVVPVNPNFTADPNRHIVFCFVKITNYTIKESGEITPLRPYHKIEYWNYGKQLNSAEAEQLIIKKTGIRPSF